MFILLSFQEQSPSGVEEDECLWFNWSGFQLVNLPPPKDPPKNKALLEAYYPLVSLNNALLNPELWRVL